MQTTLRRELRLRDLVFFDICAIISLRWVAAAAHAGPGSFVLWIVAAIFFFLPSAITVAGLARKFPESVEGGYGKDPRALGERVFNQRHGLIQRRKSQRIAVDLLDPVDQFAHIGLVQALAQSQTLLHQPRKGV